MAKIVTIDGENYSVLESKEEIDKLVLSYVDTVQLNLIVNITSFKNNIEQDRQEHQPVTFIVGNIIMYY